MHLDEEQVQRLLHDELPPSAATVAREHLVGCGDCRARVAGARQEDEEVHAALRRLDHPAPRTDVRAVVARARTHDRGRGRWAAGIAALLVAGAAYAMTGAPLPGWLANAVERIVGRSAPSPAAPVPEPDQDQGVSGVAVAPGRRLLILFTSTQATGRAEVSLTDGAEVVVHAPIGAAAFTSDVDRLMIDNRGSSASFEIHIPRAAPSVEIRVDEIRIFLKDGDRITPVAPIESQDPYLLPLTAGR